MIFERIDDWLISHVFQPYAEDVVRESRTNGPDAVNWPTASSARLGGFFLTGTVAFAGLGMAIGACTGMGVVELLARAVMIAGALMVMRDTEARHRGEVSPDIGDERAARFVMLASCVISVLSVFGLLPIQTSVCDVGVNVTLLAGFYLRACRVPPLPAIVHPWSDDDDDHEMVGG